MSETDTHLESLLEDLCERQIEQQETEEQVLRRALKKPAEDLNDLPRLYRLEVKRLLNDHGETGLASKIED